MRNINSADVAQLRSGEAAIVARAIPARKASFATGRRVLRTLMGQDGEILRSESGAPILPDSWLASLAHDEELAVGVATRSPSIQALGVDMEPVTALDERVVGLILRDDDVAPEALSAFVAKEAAYKAWSTLGGRMLEHHDVRVRVRDEHFVADVGAELRVEGRLLSVAARRLAVATLVNVERSRPMPP